MSRSTRCGRPLSFAYLILRSEVACSAFGLSEDGDLVEVAVTDPLPALRWDEARVCDPVDGADPPLQAAATVLLQLASLRSMRDSTIDRAADVCARAILWDFTQLPVPDDGDQVGEWVRYRWLVGAIRRFSPVIDVNITDEMPTRRGDPRVPLVTADLLAALGATGPLDGSS